MAVTSTLQFNFTPTDRAATSYTSLERADTYFLQRPNSTNWSSATDDEKAAALITATRAIETYPGIIDNRFLNYNTDQALRFPRRTVVTQAGIIDSATSNTIVDSDLASQQSQANDYWNFGAIRITSGTGLDQVREISDFIASSGTVEIVSNWSTNPDATSNYEIIHSFPDEIYWAACMIAFLYTPDATTSVVDDGTVRTLLQSQNVKSFTVDDHSEVFTTPAGYMIPGSAAQILDKYVARCY